MLPGAHQAITSTSLQQGPRCPMSGVPGGLPPLVGLVCGRSWERAPETILGVSSGLVHLKPNPQPQIKWIKISFPCCRAQGKGESEAGVTPGVWGWRPVSMAVLSIPGHAASRNPAGNNQARDPLKQYTVDAKHLFPAILRGKTRHRQPSALTQCLSH